MRRLRVFIYEMYQSHKFFMRKSQHYVLGNWSEYVPFSKDKWNKYYKRFIPAYLKFMYLCAKDYYKLFYKGEKSV